jgi:hypothetical protein
MTSGWRWGSVRTILDLTLNVSFFVFLILSRRQLFFADTD